MFGQAQSAGTGDHGMNGEFSQESWAFLEEKKEFLNVGKMPLIVRKKKIFFSSRIAIFTVVEPMSIPKVYRFCVICTYRKILCPPILCME